MINSGKTIEQIAQEVIEAGGVMEPMIDIPWEPAEEGVKKGLELNDVSFMAKVVELNKNGSIVVESVTGAEMLKKNDYDTYEIIRTDKPGVRYTVNLTFDFTPEIGKVYRLKGQYDSKTNNIIVYHFLFFNEYYED